MTRDTDMTPVKRQIRELIAQTPVEATDMIGDSFEVSAPPTASSKSDETTPDRQAPKRAPVVLTRTAKTILDVLNCQREILPPSASSTEDSNLRSNNPSAKHDRTPDKDLPIVELPEPPAVGPHSPKEPLDLDNNERRPSLPADLPRFHFDLGPSPDDNDNGNRETSRLLSDPSLPRFEFDIQ